MAVKEHVRRGRIDPIPETIESTQGKLVYLLLDVADGATVDDLSEILSMKKISILSVLRTLANEGLVEERGSEYVVSSRRRVGTQSIADRSGFRRALDRFERALRRSTDFGRLPWAG
ncbi:hypothetical protein ACFQGT_06040 [Natrialbaceae archaeon GCM10025810]|uniref:hypothetical protein n=1 Tax=Halovalidus salilacus TaxID=3075124 RepID=UPI0036090087